MVPKIHKKRQNFRSTANYLLHGQAANSNDRVEWTATRNLATKDPDMAWRVMAATSMDQDRLKQQAGVPNTGRKSKDHVLHFTLSWHPEEAQQLTKAEMIRAANTILHVMGAERHQSLMVAHNDQPQPHVHVMVNRVNPRDGRILSSSFEKLKASRWAEAYEKQRGKIYCHNRVLNNEARDRDEYTRGDKDDPRPVYDAAQAINDNDRREAFLKEHRKRAHELKQLERRQKAAHAAAWRRHELGAADRRKRVELAARQTLAKKLRLVRDDYKPRWAALHHEQLAAQRLYEQREARFLGKVQNALRTVDLKSLLLRRTLENESRLTTLRGAFQRLADSGARQQALRDQQRTEHDALKREQLLKEHALREKLAAAKSAVLANDRDRAEQQRSDLVLSQAMERAKLRAQWLQHNQQREARLRELTKDQPKREQSPARVAPASSTRPSDLVPHEGRDQAARYADGWQRLREGRHDNDRDRDRDDGRDR